MLGSGARLYAHVGKDYLGVNGRQDASFPALQRPPGKPHAGFENPRRKKRLTPAHVSVKSPQVNATKKQFSMSRAASKSKFPAIFLTENVRN
jgi:hypothetical protein